MYACPPGQKGSPGGVQLSHVAEEIWQGFSLLQSATSDLSWSAEDKIQKVECFPTRLLMLSVLD